VYESSVSEGRISNPNKRLKSNAPVLEINMLSVYGSAGSPVLNDKHEVIGIIAPTEADRNPFVGTGEDSRRVRDNGIPLAIPAKIIQEFVQDSGTRNQQGEIDQYYQSGLELFWKEDYEAAKEKFEVVRDQFPQHSEINRLISECNKSKLDTFGKPNMIVWGAIAAVVALVSGMIFFLMSRRPSTTPRPAADVKPFARHSPTGVPKSNHSNVQAWLELEGLGETRKLALYKETHRIGRDPAWSDIEMPASWEVLSRHHALFRREGDSYRVFDGDGKVPSRNGLLVDDYDKVDSFTGHLLRSGDTLSIGSDPREQVRITYFSSAAGQVKDETKVAT
jgi:FHA domain